MNTRFFRIFVSASFTGHVVAFTALALFSFSLSAGPERIHFKPVVFCSNIAPEPISAILSARPSLFPGSINPSLQPRALRSEPVLSDYYVKPAVTVSFSAERQPVKAVSIQATVSQRKDSVLLLHPLLPYQFDLYFKDRQAVYIELEFAITQANDRNFVSLRRKISSGNLEADLLSMRYIGHYLFIQQARFTPATWQKVKIEFSPNISYDTH
jgi:hypothetical protein